MAGTRPTMTQWDKASHDTMGQGHFVAAQVQEAKRQIDIDAVNGTMTSRGHSSELTREAQ
jgi:hypothetical protein